MSSFVRKHKILVASLTAIGALILLSVLWDMSAAARGKIDAHTDLAFGHYKIMGYGLPGPEREGYVRLLHARYGIEFEKLADCIVSESLVNYANSYNAVSVAAIKNKFGNDILHNTFEDAQREWLRGPGKEHWPPVKYLFSYIPDQAHDPACFRAFAPGASMYKIVEQCGYPDEEIGSSAYIFVYHLQHGSVIISGRYLHRMDKIIYKES
jgi:hypothetical protein